MNNDSASDEEDSSVVPEDSNPEDNNDNNSNNNDLEDKDNDEDLLINSLYKSRSGVQWAELPKSLLCKKKAKNIIKHKAGPKVKAKTEVSECELIFYK